MADSLKLTWGMTDGGVPSDWPKAADGTPEAPVLLRHMSGNLAEADILVSMLRSYGIPALRACGNYGTLGKIILGYSGEGLDLFVPESMLEDANNLLQPVDETALIEEEKEETK